MIYDECINHFEKLKDMLIFQERRNFFNKINDKHLITSIDIVKCILERSAKEEISNSDLAEITKITTSMLCDLNLSNEIKLHLETMNEFANS